MWRLGFNRVHIELTHVETIYNASGDNAILLVICMEAPESTINSLSSGFTVETDATLHSMLGEKNVASVSRQVPRILYNFLTQCQASSSHSVLFGSLSSNVGALGLR